MLSEEKIKKLAKGHSDFYIDSKRRETYDFCTGGILNFARAIEAAVLAELAKIGAVAEWVSESALGAFLQLVWTECYTAKAGDKLFLHPAPVVPEGMVLVPKRKIVSSAGDAIDHYNEGWNACIDAMLTAAEKP